MKEKLTIIKVGGKIVEEEETLQRLLTDFAAIPGKKLLVHGGGRSATRLAAQLGIESQMVNGRRITDADTLRVVTMVYGGLVNKNIVAGLQAHGVNALGLTGADMNVIRSHKRPVKDVDYGFVGDVDEVNAEFLGKLISEGVVPVMAPLTHDKQGHLLNTNADTIAGETAKALARFGAAETKPVVGMEFSYDQDKVDAIIADTYRMEGIHYIRVWLNQGQLQVGDDIMYVLIGGDIRPHVVDALQYLVGRIKNECVEETEIYG